MEDMEEMVALRTPLSESSRRQVLGENVALAYSLRTSSIGKRWAHL